MTLLIGATLVAATDVACADPHMNGVIARVSAKILRTHNDCRAFPAPSNRDQRNISKWSSLLKSVPMTSFSGSPLANWETKSNYRSRNSSPPPRDQDSGVEEQIQLVG